MSSDPNQRCMICRAIGFVIAAIVVGLITWWLFGKVAAWLAILAFLGLFALGLWFVLKYCGEPVSYGAGAAVGAAAATGAAAAANAHKFEGGCEHIKTYADHNPIDSHDCHCSVCKSVTGQPTTHVTFFKHEDFKVSNEANLQRQPFNADNPDGPLELCVCGDCGTPIMLDDKESRIRAVVPNLMGHDPAAMPTTYHAFYDPATGVPRPDDGKPVHEGLRPDFVWPEGHTPAASGYTGGCEHVQTHSDHDPIDSHDCHCSVCKSVTGQPTTHVTFFNHEDLQVSDMSKLTRQPFNADNPDGPLELCVCGDCGTPIMLDDKHKRVRAIVPNLMGHDPAAMPTTYHAFYDPATGVPRPNDGKPVHEALRPDFVWPEGDGSAARAAELAALQANAGEVEKLAEDAGAQTDAGADAAARAKAEADAEAARAKAEADAEAARLKAETEAAKARAEAAAAEKAAQAAAAGAGAKSVADGVSGRATSTSSGVKPEGLSGPRGGQADDLKRIKGVGPAMEKMVNGMGFYHFDQVAAWGDEEVAWVDDNLEGFKGRVTRDRWVPQARLLADGKVVSDEVMERIRAGEDVDLTDYDNDGVSEGRTGEGSKPETLSGPRGGKADDLKQIKGVGPKLEGVVNSLGFYHFDQIASWTPDEVAWVDAQLKFKGRIDRDGWIEQAKILAAGGTTEFSKKVDKGGVY